MTAIPTDLAATIPKDWTVSELGKAAHLKNGSAFKPDDWKTTGVPIVRIQNLKDRNAAFNYFQGNPDLKVPLKNGDLVFSWSGSIGTSFGPHYWWGDVAVLNQHIFRVDLKPETKLTKPFLYYALLHLTKEIESHAYGLAALVHVRKGDLEATRVPVPTGPEQWKIAGVLGLVQRAMEQQERLIALTTELKRALLYQLFTQGLRGELQRQTEIGPVPKSWDVVPLNTFLAEPLRNGHSAKVSNNGEGIRTLTLTAVTRKDFSVENTKLTVADPHRVRDMWLRSGDILVERANTFEYVGLTALYEGPSDFAIYPDLMIRVRVDKDRIRPRFLAEFLITPVCRSYFQKQARSTAGNFPKIDQGTVE